MVVFDNFSLIPGNLGALVMYYWAFAEIAIILSLIGLAYTVSIIISCYYTVDSGCLAHAPISLDCKKLCA